MSCGAVNYRNSLGARKSYSVQPSAAGINGNVGGEPKSQSGLLSTGAVNVLINSSR